MYISVNGIRLAYEASGQGEPLLLLHGNGEDRHTFDVLMPLLAQRYTVYAIDSRGHGESAPTDDYSYQTMTDDVAGFIRALDLGPVRILGFSDGAIVALMLAIARPESVSHLLLCGVNLSPADFKTSVLKKLHARYRETHDPLLRLMLTQPFIDYDDVRRVTQPTLVVAGEREFFTPESFQDLVATLPHSRFLLMKGHDHGSYIHDSDALYADADAFFQTK